MFNFFGVRDSINFNSNFYYAMFCSVPTDINTLSSAQIYTYEVLGIPRKQVTYSLTTNQITQQKIITLSGVLAEALSLKSFNTVVLVDESASSAQGIQGTFILATYQNGSSIEVDVNSPVKINFGKILLNHE